MTLRKWLTLIYIGLIIGIIIIADQGEYKYLLRWAYAIPFGDKVGHFFLVGILAGLINLWWECARWQWRLFSLLKGSVIVATIMTLEEFSQYFIKTRTFDLGDLGCDYVGIFIFGYFALRCCQQETEQHKLKRID